ncbi:DUF4350 domain-containing protein [Streptomyces sp. URMC 123]|uniref:DUF4350 domain-containing protein n=1 Tax=Streptomyces sp. URMC 123 TaxID=3423403 RepID=UPI003F1D9275
MTAAPTASASPTPRQLWTVWRGTLLAIALLLVAGTALAALRSEEQHGRLDPRSTDPSGSRAVAELLADRGVTTRTVTTSEEALDATGPNTTLLVTRPDLLTKQQQSALSTAGETGGRTVLLAPGPSSVGTLVPGVRAATPTEVTVRVPACSLDDAVRAGEVELGGVRYVSPTPGSDACYSDDGLPTLLRRPTASGGDTVLLGAADLLRNDHLARQGNASLALHLLGSRPHLVWYLPSLDDAAATDPDDRNFLELIPSGWNWALLQLVIAAGLAALWRARRLGPLVGERLPVTVRAAEATEGRARLYHQANARDHAAETLRAATRARLAPLLGVPRTRADAPKALLPALTSRLQRPDLDARTVLFGPAPPDDAALVRLADQLDALERRLTSTSTHTSDAASPPGGGAGSDVPSSAARTTPAPPSDEKDRTS